MTDIHQKAETTTSRCSEWKPGVRGRPVSNIPPAGLMPLQHEKSLAASYNQVDVLP